MFLIPIDWFIYLKVYASRSSVSHKPRPAKEQYYYAATSTSLADRFLSARPDSRRGKIEDYARPTREAGIVTMHKKRLFVTQIRSEQSTSENLPR